MSVKINLNFPLIQNEAVFSHDGTYRYYLGRVWEPEKPQVTFIMLNPSMADVKKNDPTVERCQRRAKALGYGTIHIVNIFGLKSTDPRELYRSKNPIGQYTDQYILEATRMADTVICAWGKHGMLLNRGNEVLELISKECDPYCLKKNKDGSPSHPLYLGYSTEPVKMIECIG